MNFVASLLRWGMYPSPYETLNWFILKIDFRERKEKERREISTCCSTYLCIHWLLLVCALIWDPTRNPGLSGRCSDQMSDPARA